MSEDISVSAWEGAFSRNSWVSLSWAVTNRHRIGDCWVQTSWDYSWAEDTWQTSPTGKPRFFMMFVQNHRKHDKFRSG